MDFKVTQAFALLCHELIERGQVDDAIFVLQYEILPIIEKFAGDDINLFGSAGMLTSLHQKMISIEETKPVWNKIMDVIEQTLCKNHYFYNRIEFLARKYKEIGVNDRAEKMYELLLSIVMPGASEEDPTVYKSALDSLIELYELSGKKDKYDYLLAVEKVVSSTEDGTFNLWKK